MRIFIKLLPLQSVNKGTNSVNLHKLNMKFLTKFIFLSLLIILSTTFKSHGQASSSDAKRKNVADKDKVWQPGASPEQTGESGSQKQNEPKRPLTKKELGKKLKHDEVEQKKNYEQFHDKIQSKKVRKRMKENEKKSKSVNNHERPSFWKRLSIKFKKRR